MRMEFLKELTEDHATLLYSSINKNRTAPIDWELFKSIRTVRAYKSFITVLPSLKEEYKLLGEELKAKLLDEIKTTSFQF